MKRATATLAVLVLLCAGSLRAGMDPEATRQSAGIFVTIDGKVHTIYLDFEAAKHRRAREQIVPVTFTTDIDVRIQGHLVPAGKYHWTFSAEESSRWTIGEVAATGAKKKKKDTKKLKRFLFDLRDAGSENPYLTAGFCPDHETDLVLLRIRFGHREGTLRLAFTEKAAAPRSGKEVDMIALKTLRDRLLQVAGKLESTRKNRLAWSGFLREAGDAVLGTDGTCYIEEADLEREAETLNFKLRGSLVGSRDEVDRLCSRVSSGQLSRLFERVGSPLARKEQGHEGWRFEFFASAGKEWWERSDAVPALSEGAELSGLSEEILLLEARLAKETSDSILTLAECQARLLRAKREAGVIIKKIEAADPVQGEHGLGHMDVNLCVAGSGAALVTFVRAVENWVAPLRLVPLRIRQGAFGPEAELELRFYRYTPLSVRDPGVYGSVKAAGMSATFAKDRDLYLRGIGVGASAPFTPPEWKRDPFAVVVEEE
ncbi:MAG: hypothetical protein ACYS99_06550 [Planctomycetota bacterium]|jgi:hypothetical protein